MHLMMQESLVDAHSRGRKMSQATALGARVPLAELYVDCAGNESIIWLRLGGTMLQIKNLSITHKKDLRSIVQKFSLVLNDGDKAVMIGEEGNGKSTVLKWIYDPEMIEDYAEGV